MMHVCAWLKGLLVKDKKIDAFHFEDRIIEDGEDSDCDDAVICISGRVHPAYTAMRAVANTMIPADAWQGDASTLVRLFECKKECPA